ncbi:MAG: DUF6273 domain-containing protein [Oscillospiraceae bacterium]|nr:DUF6273 domain-containing protein [Oscillospiraceae bacterium]
MKKKRFIFLGGGVVVLAALVALVIFFVVPQSKYSGAQKQKNENKAAQAYDTYDALGDFRDAQALKKALQDAVIASRGVVEVEFAGRTWLVLEEKDGNRLLLLKNMLAELPYHTSLEDVTWETSSLRAYLNGAFLQSLPKNDRDRVQTVGSDAVFCLSVPEAKLYFADNAAREASFNGGANVYWWLRTSGSKAFLAATVSAAGEIGTTGSGVNYAKRYVRPALWVSIPN